MLIIGLTGSIGMGKSTTAQMFRDRGVPVFDADATVHDIYAGPEAAEIDAAFPGTLVDGRIDRVKLSEHVVGNDAAMKRLEAIVHPMVHARETKFLREAREAGSPFAVLDVPLLFENGSQGRCDVVAVVSAPAEVQRKRVLERPGMSLEKFEAILARQVPDAEKRARADFIIPTGNGLPAAEKAVDEMLAECAARTGTAYANRMAGR
ncbi:dephospho-CoA kinase [Tepidamorphus sp. 3E244]|uniref:dephospho-CoA kinase n=1 Tax=Tepidamorphus sp. 3E244 TaxID=3385498 RepID=UPI0038FBEB6C